MSSVPRNESPARFLPPIAGGEKKTGWEALDKWVGSGGGEGASAPAAAAPSAPSGKTGWEALDKWVGSGGGSAGGAAAGAAATGAATGGGQEKAADLKEDLAELRKELPDMNEVKEGGTGFVGFLKKLFRGK